MDKETRNAIERATQKARRLLEEDFAEQLDGVFDARADGRIANKGGAHLTGRQHLLRDKIVAAIEHKRSAGMKPEEAVADYVRDAAFTALNRFTALKMLEARELVQECVSRGDASTGFVEFCGLAPALKTPDGAGYRLYIESIFDELSTEVKVLFDRRDPASVLWPTKLAFDELLAVLNHTDLIGIWSEDETIGWVYQFFNSDDERRKMRAESQAPRNSRELAIRNQFFTPSYVVQFLCDNTLGRIWYAMRGGDTRLSAVCEYLVHNAGGDADEDGADGRAKKDPRDIRIIDPACGSGHFLLYCFLLLLIIYEEAWADEGSPESGATGRTLRADYSTLEELRKAAPALILSHNLHGVDIDPRCAQIAQLALWMRGQRAFKEAGVLRSDRPVIRRANIVIAEPMPGDAKLLDEFAATLRPAFIASLFKEIVSEMRLAGEMGAMLPIERKLSISIQNARLAFSEQAKRSEDFLPGFAPIKRQGELDLSGIDNFAFFERAEEQMFGSLKTYVSDAVNGRGTRRRLFADDAEQGIAFVEIMGRKFDVVLMNPPFGASSVAAAEEIDKCYPISCVNLYAAFVERGVDMLIEGGRLGVISPRSGFFLSTFEKWRRQVLLEKGSLCGAIDLGYGVLEAKVETAAYTVLQQNPRHTHRETAIYFANLQFDEDKASVLSSIVRELAAGQLPSRVSIVRRSELEAIPTNPFAYELKPPARLAFKNFAPFASADRTVKAGIQTSDDFRFVRLWWEVPVAGIMNIPPELFEEDEAAFQSRLVELTTAFKWCGYAKGGEYSPFFADLPLLLNWKNNGREAKAYAETTPGTKHWSRRMPASEFYFRPGLSFLSRTSVRMCAFPLPAGILFSNEAGPAIFGPKNELPLILGRFNSLAIETLLAVFQSRGLAGDDQAKKYMVGTLQQTPWPNYSDQEKEKCSLTAVRLMQTLRATDETSPSYLGFTVSSESDLVDRITNEALSIEEYVGASYGLDSAADLKAARQDFSTSLLIGQRKTSAEHAVYSFLLGCAFGRWNLGGSVSEKFDAFRFQRPMATLSDPKFAVLSDDPGSELDIVEAATQKNFVQLVLSAKPEISVEPDAFREYLQTKFFDRHIKQYSRSQRKAPIYWQLSVPSRKYSVWMYTQAFSNDTLFRVKEVIGKKLAYERRQLNNLLAESGANPTAAEAHAIEAQRLFVDEIQTLQDEVVRVLPMWQPNLDDGVIINAAPLWRLFGSARSWQNDCKAAWDALSAGTYDWSSVSIRLWPERVIAKCAADRSLAVAHGLETNFWFEDGDGKWVKRDKPERSIDALIRERGSTSVKAALRSLLEAGDTTTTAKRKRKSKAA
jgi:hypothetical protein